jgi:hypothetical protein
MDNLKLNGITLDRLEDRKTLLTGFDQFRRELDQSGLVEGMDAFNQQAFNILTSSKLMEASHLGNRSSPPTASIANMSPANIRRAFVSGGAGFIGSHIADRLVEAGARCVTLNFGRWDFHSNNHSELLTHLPLFDQAMSALVEDLHQRGLDKDVAVVAWGEFGRTPQINPDAGRDHWPQVGCALLAGGGMKTGRSLAPQIASAEPSNPAAFISGKSSPPCITNSASTRPCVTLPISDVLNTLWTAGGNTGTV